MRLTKFNEETGQYEYIEKAKTLAEYRAQRKAAIQKLGEYEDMATRYMAYSDGRIERIPPAEGEWIVITEERDTLLGKVKLQHKECSVCGYPMGLCGSLYCGNCGAKMKGENDEQR